MINSSVVSLLALLIAALAVTTMTTPAHAKSDSASNLAMSEWVDQTVYRPNCPRVEYDQRCLFDACAPVCDRR